MTRTTIVRSRLVTKRTHAKLMRDLNREVMTRHLDNTIPKHFQEVPETAPGGEYGYRERAKLYTRAKRRAKGHAKPNVWTGELQKSVIGRARITGTQHSSSLIMKGTPKHRLTDWQRREIEIVTRPERREHAAWLQKEYAKRIQRWEYLAQRIRK